MSAIKSEFYITKRHISKQEIKTTIMSQQYSLRWNNHQPNFISMFTTLLNTQTLVDVTLAAEGRHMQAHKVVLSACSTYFQSLFVDNPSHHPIVILKDVTFADLRTMVDFMYCGEVNVTEEQLPQVLETAKVLKIKGLTEMPESTLTRAQGSGVPGPEFAPNAETSDAQRMPTPAMSPSNKRRRRRKSSTGSTSLNMISEDGRAEDSQTVELVRDGITLSSVPQRRRDFHDERNHDTTQQQPENQHNMNMDTLGVENPASIAQDWQTVTIKPRRLKRQYRVSEEGLRRQTSEPTTAPPQLPQLRKHDSYPQYAAKKWRVKREERGFGSVLIRTVSIAEGEGSGGGTRERGADEKAATSEAPEEQKGAPRARHTPAVRFGPPLSCNFCWNTVDECGRILRRKTQYHCPECRTNLCIVPCFHEYHELTSNSR